MKKRYILTVLILCMVLLTSLFVFSSCLKKKPTPIEYINNAIAATLEARTDTSVLSVLKSAEEKGSLSFIYKNTNDFATLGMPVDSFSIRQYAKENGSAAVFDISVGGKTADLYFWMTNDKFAVSSSLAGNTVYGTDLTNIKENYLNSVFADPESEYSLVELFGQNGENPDTIKDISEIEKKLMKILEKYGDQIMLLLNDNAQTSLDSEKGGKIVSLELNNESIKKILKALYDKAKEDSELRDTVVALIGMYGNMLPVADDEISAWTIPEEEDRIVYDGNDIIKEYDRFFASEDQLEELFKEFDKYNFNFRLDMNTDKKDLIQSVELSFGAVSSEDSAEVSWIFTADLSNEKKSVFTVKQTGGNANSVLSSGVTLTYEVTEDSNTEYRSNLSIKTGGVTLDVLDVEFNKVSGEYKLSSAIAKTLAAISDGTLIGEVSMSGIFRADKSSVTVTVTSLQMGEEKLSADITLIALAKDTVPDYPGEVVEIFTLDEKAIEQLITKIEAEIGEFGLGDMP